jgi:very-short-patch-repair endonuclease
MIEWQWKAMVCGALHDSAKEWAIRRSIDFANRVEDSCESPIEKSMAAALAVALGATSPERSSYFSFKLPFDRAVALLDRLSAEHEAAEEFSCTIVVPQCQLSRYRVDFLVMRKLTLAWRPGVKLIAVECDGHDFHERTKEQAARDRSRDRALQGLDVMVMRFTGAEIFADVKRCASEVLQALDRWEEAQSAADERETEKKFAEWVERNPAVVASSLAGDRQ